MTKLSLEEEVRALRLFRDTALDHIGDMPIYIGDFFGNQDNPKWMEYLRVCEPEWYAETIQIEDDG